MAKEKKYSFYNLHDFLEDERFVRWVKNGDYYSNKFWHNWMENNPDKIQTILKAKEIINSVKYSQEYEMSSTRASHLFEDILKEKKKQNQNGTKIILKIAASIALLLISYIAFLNVDADLTESNPQATIIKSTSKGEKITFALPDGSIVKINASTTIKYWESSMDSVRNIYLSGEGYFEVFEDPTRPFKVSTSDFTTTALGTVFNIRAYPEDSIQEYSLISGSVEVVSKFRKLDSRIVKILSPKEQLVYSRSSREILYKKFEDNDVLAWKNDVLLFKERKLTEVFRVLETWYGVEILPLNNSGKLDREFSGTFKGESLENVLKVISYSVDFDFTIEESKVFVEFEE